jgi:hypothetical protein
MGEQSSPLEVAGIAPRPEEATARNGSVPMGDVSGQPGKLPIFRPIAVLVAELDVAKEPSQPFR